MLNLMLIAHKGLFIFETLYLLSFECYPLVLDLLRPFLARLSSFSRYGVRARTDLSLGDADGDAGGASRLV